ncbi:MAG: DoxX family protein [Rubrobacteraceae bacterium]
MNVLALSPLGRMAGFGLLAARVILGIIMTAHGFQKLTQMGAGAFGEQVLGGLGVPAPVLMGYVVTFVELLGGVLLIVGLLSRLSALLLTINLIVALFLVKLGVGLIASPESGAGAELDLALIAGFLVVLFAGPGALSLDRILGIDRTTTDRGD